MYTQYLFFLIPLFSLVLYYNYQKKYQRLKNGGRVTTIIISKRNAELCLAFTVMSSLAIVVFLTW